MNWGRITAFKGNAVARSLAVKAASDVYAPVSGIVLEVNTAVADAPESVNQDAYAAWLFKLKPTNPAELDNLLDAAAYTASCEE